MAGEATVVNSLAVTGLGNNVDLSNTKIVTVPVAQQGGYTVLIAATTTALQLFALVDHFALDEIFLVYIKAVSGEVYILLNTAGTTTFAAGAAHLLLNEGESVILPIDPDNNAGMTIDGDSVAAAIEWQILAKA